MLYLDSKGIECRSVIQGWFTVKGHCLIGKWLKSGDWTEKCAKNLATFTKKYGYQWKGLGIRILKLFELAREKA